MLKYSVARLALFVVCMGVLGLLGAGLLLAMFGGLVISLLLSYVLLRRLRDPATAAIAERVEARNRRRAERADDELVEDELVQDALDQDTRVEASPVEGTRVEDAQTSERDHQPHGRQGG